MLFAAAVQPVGAWWLYAGTYIFFAVLGPLLILFWLIGQGQVADLDVTLRAERHKPFVAAVSGAGLAWIVLYALDAPPLLVHFASAHTAVISIVLVVTFYWKISVHAAGAAAVATLVSLVLDTTTIAVLPVLLVAWSRLHLGRHTLSQVLAGGCLGAGVFALLL
jgi:membrane-associated phospholipid phosphatase